MGIALRKSGSIDFYYDWRLVETQAAVPGKKEYTAIDMEFANIHFKCLQHDSDYASKSKSDQRVLVEYICPTTWKQRIGLNSSSKIKEKTKSVEALK